MRPMQPKNRFFSSKKAIVITSSIAAVILISLLVAIFLYQHSKTAENTARTTEQPQFSTILPKDKSINKLGGWGRVSPPNTEPVFAYNDTLAGVSISVSQQPLPKAFEGDEEAQVSELAKQYGATTQISAGDTKVHIGISSQGPQSVIFVKNNLLILIKSQQKIDNKDWSKYIESLS